MYMENGVFIEQSTLVQGETAKLIYNGFLFNQGAEEVYVHLGFGLLWENLSEIKMTKKEYGFEAEILLTMADTLNFCLRDNWNNWDNNSYQNYSYEVSKKKYSKEAQKSTVIETDTYISNDLGSAGINIPDVSTNNFSETPAYNFKDGISESVGSTSTRVETSQSLVPTLDNEYSQFRRLPETYLRNKKMRIMFYRMFAYIPRLLTGYNRRRAKSLLKRSKLF